jgi:hypothetical protein
MIRLAEFGSVKEVNILVIVVPSGLQFLTVNTQLPIDLKGAMGYLTLVSASHSISGPLCQSGNAISSVQMTFSAFTMLNAK